MSEGTEKAKSEYHVVDKYHRECWHSMCETCGETPCPTLNLFGEVDHWNWCVDASFIPHQGTPKPVQYCWHYYKAASHHFFGPLPKWERRKIPNCISKWFGETYSNEKGEPYVGFKCSCDDGDVNIGNMTQLISLARIVDFQPFSPYRILQF